jgi:catechol 2,3-dioxygenase-like lactoylglutathione lyase family enzyme
MSVAAAGNEAPAPPPAATAAVVAGFHHTGFVVRDLAAMTAFYRDVLGLQVQLDAELTGEPAARLTGYPGAHVRVVFLGTPGEQHVVELVRYLQPAGGDAHPERNAQGAGHLRFRVDDVDATHRTLTARGVRFVNPPIHWELAGVGPVAACYGQDPEGNALEFLKFGA